MVAGIALLYAAYLYSTGRPVAVDVVIGPDGRSWEWKGGSVAYSGMEQWLTSTYGKQIRFGSDGVKWPTRFHGRNEAQVPVFLGLGLLALGAIWYGFCWAVGWVIAGFQRADV